MCLNWSTFILCIFLLFVHTGTLHVSRLSICVPGSLLWWAPCWPTSTPTTPTPLHPPMSPLATDLLHPTLGYVQLSHNMQTVKNTCISRLFWRSVHTKSAFFSDKNMYNNFFYFILFFLGCQVIKCGSFLQV